MLKKSIIVIFIILAAGAVVYFWPKNQSVNEQNSQIVPESKFRQENIVIDPGNTFSVITENIGLPASTTQALMRATEGVYDLASFRAGLSIDFFFF
jgi:hypothetical protein